MGGHLVAVLVVRQRRQPQRPPPVVAERVQLGAAACVQAPREEPLQLRAARFGERRKRRPRVVAEVVETPPFRALRHDEGPVGRGEGGGSERREFVLVGVGESAPFVQVERLDPRYARGVHPGDAARRVNDRGGARAEPEPVAVRGGRQRGALDCEARPALAAAGEPRKARLGHRDAVRVVGESHVDHCAQVGRTHALDDARARRADPPDAPRGVPHRRHPQRQPQEVVGVPDPVAGDEAPATALVPAAVLGLTDATLIVAGGRGTCARRSSGAGVCWGPKDDGQVGDGRTTSRSSPVAVVGLP